MPDPRDASSLDAWLQAVRERFTAVAPDLLPLFETYAGEAVFGRSYIAADLARLPAGARILEVGAGALLLSCQLAREGFDVTALEPTGDGFSHFGRMRALVQAQAREEGCCPTLLDLPGEALAQSNRYDYAFSVNVMEHVADPARVLANVAASLRPGAAYRFTCPNYLFPYEPHFNIPTFGSKRVTERVLGGRIRASRIPDPEGTWASLNWITVPGVRRAARRMQAVSLRFHRSLLVTMLERVVTDSRFAARRSPAMRAALGAVVRLRMHLLLSLVPAALQPVIDCTLVKRAEGEDR